MKPSNPLLWERRVGNELKFHITVDLATTQDRFEANELVYKCGGADYAKYVKVDQTWTSSGFVIRAHFPELTDDEDSTLIEAMDHVRKVMGDKSLKLGVVRLIKKEYTL